MPVVHTLELDDNWTAVVFIDDTPEGPAVGQIRILPAAMSADAQYRLQRLIADTEVSWTPTMPSMPLTTAALRRLNLEQLVSGHRRPSDPPDARRVCGADLQRLLCGPRRPGRAGRDERFWALVAWLYTRAVWDGSPNPAASVAEWLSQLAPTAYTATQARGLVRAARRNGMLSEAPRGRAGGSLTAKARELLERDAPREGLTVTAGRVQPDDARSPGGYLGEPARRVAA